MLPGDKAADFCAEIAACVFCRARSPNLTKILVQSKQLTKGQSQPSAKMCNTRAHNQGMNSLRSTFIILLTVIVLATPFGTARAQDYATLFRDFRAAGLSQDDKRFLQAALAFEGDYNGLLDGAWGQRSQRALEAFSWREFGTDAEEWHMVILAMGLFGRVDKEGWTRRHFDLLDMSVLFPAKTAISEAPTQDFLNWRHGTSSLSYSLGSHDYNTTARLHEYTLQWHGAAEAPYLVRKDGFAVTSAKRRDGSILYTRSNWVGGRWSTIMLSASARDKDTLNAVSASIAAGRARDLAVTRGGRLERAILLALDAMEQEEEPNSGSQPPPSSASPGDVRSSGSGFYVSEDGYVLTNAHVVGKCRNLFVDDAPARVVDTNETFDLALLKTTMAERKSVAVFSQLPAKLNSDVTAVGYPYSGWLGGLNVTRGSVSALKGLRGDLSTMQITAPVQPGNSGGPLVGPDGDVVGVVVSKLNAIKFAEEFGDIPQNVNFAVRGEIAKLYLSQNGVDPRVGVADEKLDAVVLADQAADFTVFIECR